MHSTTASGDGCRTSEPLRWRREIGHPAAAQPKELSGTCVQQLTYVNLPILPHTRRPKQWTRMNHLSVCDYAEHVRREKKDHLLQKQSGMTDCSGYRNMQSQGIR